MKITQAILLATLSVLAAAPASAARYTTSFSATVVKEAIPFPGQTDVPPPETTDFSDETSTNDGLASIAVDWSVRPLSDGALWTGIGTASAGPGVFRLGMSRLVRSVLPDERITEASFLGVAEFSDRVSATGAPDLDSLEFTFRIDGTLSGRNASISACGGNATSVACLDRSSAETAFVDEDLVFRVGLIDGAADLDFFLMGDLGFTAFSDAGDDAATLDFLNTAKLTAVAGRNAAGGRVSLSSATGAGNADYLAIAAANAAVPEPASWAMMIAGFAAVGGAMRRRASAMPIRA